jgi:hypothetical protein
LDKRLLTLALLPAFAAPALAQGAEPLKPLSSLGPLRPAPSPGPLGPELVPIPPARALAPSTSVARPGKSVDGIRCEVNERVLFHVHAHVAVFVKGKPRAIPAGIGIWPPLGPQNYRHGQFGITQGNCFSWLTTHYADGIVHIESPVRRPFRLGQLFDLWGQPLGRDRVGPAIGAVTAIVNRTVWTADPRLIPLTRHAQIQLEVGSPLVAPQNVAFPGGF